MLLGRKVMWFSEGVVLEGFPGIAPEPRSMAGMAYAPIWSVRCS